MSIFNDIMSSGPKPRPIFTAANCINRRQRKTKCSVCHELCPGKVFSMDPKKPLDWDKCLNCGLCVSTCPSRCFAPDAALQNTYTQNLRLDRPISFCCETESRLCDKSVVCLAGIPWELLAVLSLYTDIVLYVGACDSCGDETKLSHLRDNLGKLRSFLGEELFSSRVHILKDGEFTPPAAEEKLMSRRDVFSDVKSSFMKSAVSLAASRLPFLDEADTDGLQYRRLLSNTVLRIRNDSVKAIKEAQAAGKTPEQALPSYSLRLPVFNSRCYGCGICEKLCPQGALEIGPETGGKRMVYITPWKCTECGLCVNACPSGGLSGFGYVKLPYLERLPLVKISSGTCQGCGRAIAPDAPDSLCDICRTRKNKSPVRLA